MSTELLKINDLQVTRFWGGDLKGVCIQLTGENGFVQLNRDEFQELYDVLVNENFIKFKDNKG